MLPWSEIDTVLLDMDGTLLDLHYDNHFWLHHVPQRYAEGRGLPFAEAHQDLLARYQKVAGTMQWYCVDYWTAELGLDIAHLKQELAHLIAVHPDVPEFLEWLRVAGKRVVLVTNAHHKSLSLKMAETGLGVHFDAMISAHEFGVPKEDPSFWGKLQTREPFEKSRTLFIDDSLPVLRSARGYGIAHLLGIYQPDSKQARKNMEDFAAIERFAQIMPSKN